MTRRAIKSRRVLLESGIQQATIIISDNKIEDVFLASASNSLPDSIDVEDFGDLVIMPGLIDSHVHINEPGRTTWEGFESATKAAAAGGITTLIDMPLNSSPVTTRVDAFHKKLNAAKNKCSVHCGFYGGIIPSNTTEIKSLIEAGVFGIKAFLTHSGIDEFPNVGADELNVIMPILTEHNIPLLVHCELFERHAGLEQLEQHPASYEAYLASRPDAWESNAIKLMLDLCQRHRTSVHIVHVSSAQSLDLIREAKSNGLPVTAETCPHYLYFNSEGISDGNTLLKCAPPIRKSTNNEELWKALEDDTLDFIVTDHSPSPMDLKHVASGSFQEAWGGIASLQYSLAATWTKAQKRNWTVEHLSNKMSSNVANFLDLSVKGKIKKDYDADLVIWGPEETFVVKPEHCFHRHPTSPYDDKQLKGVVKQTIVSGQVVFKNGNTFKSNGDILLKQN